VAILVDKSTQDVHPFDPFNLRHVGRHRLAVRDGHVYTLREETALHPSQFVGDTARRFAELIHPEAFEKK